MDRRTSDRDSELRKAVVDALDGISDNLDALDLVGEIPALERLIEEIAAARVEAARGEGASWAAIADRLGVTRQAAHKRFASEGATKRKKRRGIELEIRLGRGE